MFGIKRFSVSASPSFNSFRNSYSSFSCKYFSTTQQGQGQKGEDLKSIDNSKDSIFLHLNSRNLISQISQQELVEPINIQNLKNTKTLLDNDSRCYIGFDPTAESLHLGNLVGLLTAVRFGLFGIDPIFLLGGATGLIGDPSGKSKQRQKLSEDKVEQNSELIKNNITQVLNSMKLNPDLKNFYKSIPKNNTNVKENNKNEPKARFKEETKNNLSFDELANLYKKSQKDKIPFNTYYDSNIDYKQIKENFETKKLNKFKELFKKAKADTNPFNYAIVNNQEFYNDLSVIDFLRDVGFNLRMGSLLSRENVKNRICSKEGLSLAEFMYQTFQGFDFLKLNELYNVKIQLGGSDQWGNMLAGYDLIKKEKNIDVINLTFPLLTAANGEKFGKSEGNALFINPTLTPIYNIYQYFHNMKDNEIEKLLLTFSFLEAEEIKDLIDFHSKNPEKRLAQKTLGEKVVGLLYSEEEVEKCRSNCKVHGMTASKMFEEAKLAKLNLDGTTAASTGSESDKEHWEQVLGQCQVVEINDDCIDKLTISKLCVEYKIVNTRTQCKRLIQSGSMFINDLKITDDVKLSKEMLLCGKYIVVKTGKKNIHLFQLKSNVSNIANESVRERIRDNTSEVSEAGKIKNLGVSI